MMGRTVGISEKHIPKLSLKVFKKPAWLLTDKEFRKIQRLAREKERKSR
jgi:hypothetical protein